MKEYYTIDVAGVKRDLPLCALTDELYIGAFVISYAHIYPLRC